MTRSRIDIVSPVPDTSMTRSRIDIVSPVPGKL